MPEIFPGPSVPYYIFAPSYVHTSSGVRVLHLLCHHLNAAGKRAYIIPTDNNGVTNPDLLTPIVNQKIIDEYVRRGVEPIVVYSDTIRGNPINAKRVVRYLLAPAGIYGGDTQFSPDEQIWLYKAPCDNGIKGARVQGILPIPASNPNIFYPPKDNAPRSGSCYYAHKYDRIHGNALQPVTANSTRLEGSLEYIADVLRKSDVCYLYELTALLTEAPLCGCPIVLLRSPYLNKCELGDYLAGDIRWDDGEVVIKQTQTEINNVYQKFIDDFWVHLADFIQKTQNW